MPERLGNSELRMVADDLACDNVSVDGCETWKQRIENGGRAVLAIENASIVGICWIARDKYFDIDTGSTIPLAPPQAWLFGSWVSRQRRRQGIYHRLLRSAALDLEQEGIRELLLAIDRTNFISRAVHQQLGARKIGSLFGVRWFGNGEFQMNITDPAYKSLTQNSP